MMKKAILGLGVLMLLLALVVSPALAAEAVNEETGEDSQNLVVAAELDFDVVYNGNLAGLINFTSAQANTGFNGLSGEDGNSIGSGSAGALANTSNFQNTNLSVIEGEDGDKVLAKNFKTGKDSVNWAIAADLDVAAIVNLNAAGLCNFTYAGANSGFNYIGGETCNSGCPEGDENSIVSGSASAGANTTNVQNTNLSMISVAGEGGAITAENSTTGEDSENLAVAANIDAAVVVNWNLAMLGNSTVALANTGFNGISGEDTNSIKTGAATAGANTSNFQNTNLTVIEQGGSEAIASNKAGKEADDCEKCPGEGCLPDICLDNLAVAVDVEVAAVVNENVAVLGNETEAQANSGMNGVAGEDENSITTGDASAGSNSTNVQNTNMTVITGNSNCFPSICPVDGGSGCMPSNCQ